MVTGRRTLKELAADLEAAQVEEPACVQIGDWDGFRDVIARGEAVEVEMSDVIQRIEREARA